MRQAPTNSKANCKNRDAKTPQHGNPITYRKTNSVVYLRGGECKNDEKRAPPFTFQYIFGDLLFRCKRSAIICAYLVQIRATHPVCLQPIRKRGVQFSSVHDVCLFLFRIIMTRANPTPKTHPVLEHRSGYSYGLRRAGDPQRLTRRGTSVQGAWSIHTPAPSVSGRCRDDPRRRCVGDAPRYRA